MNLKGNLHAKLNFIKKFRDDTTHEDNSDNNINNNTIVCDTRASSECIQISRNTFIEKEHSHIHAHQHKHVNKAYMHRK